jgi:heme oxygenase (mycobilin-producing)
MEHVPYVVMNVVDVPAERAREFEERFAKRAGRVQDSPGFEAFELLKPADAQTKYIVYTRWESKDAFEAWVNSSDFAAGHRQHANQGPVSQSSETWTFDLLEGTYR